MVRKRGVTEQTYDRWKREYGDLRTDQAKRLKALEKENTRLKRLRYCRSHEFTDILLLHPALLVVVSF